MCSEFGARPFVHRPLIPVFDHIYKPRFLHPTLALFPDREALAGIYSHVGNCCSPYCKETVFVDCPIIRDRPGAVFNNLDTAARLDVCECLRQELVPICYAPEEPP